MENKQYAEYKKSTKDWKVKMNQRENNVFKTDPKCREVQRLLRLTDKLLKSAEKQGLAADQTRLLNDTVQNLREWFKYKDPTAGNTDGSEQFKKRYSFQLALMGSDFDNPKFVSSVNDRMRVPLTHMRDAVANNTSRLDNDAKEFLFQSCFEKLIKNRRTVLHKLDQCEKKHERDSGKVRVRCKQDRALTNVFAAPGNSEPTKWQATAQYLALVRMIHLRYCDLLHAQTRQGIDQAVLARLKAAPTQQDEAKEPDGQAAVEGNEVKGQDDAAGPGNPIKHEIFVPVRQINTTAPGTSEQDIKIEAVQQNQISTFAKLQEIRTKLATSKADNPPTDQDIMTGLDISKPEWDEIETDEEEGDEIKRDDEAQGTPAWEKQSELLRAVLGVLKGSVVKTYLSQNAIDDINLRVKEILDFNVLSRMVLELKTGAVQNAGESEELPKLEIQLQEHPLTQRLAFCMCRAECIIPWKMGIAIECRAGWEFIAVPMFLAGEAQLACVNRCFGQLQFCKSANGTLFTPSVQTMLWSGTFWSIWDFPERTPHGADIRYTIDYCTVSMMYNMAAFSKYMLGSDKYLVNRKRYASYPEMKYETADAKIQERLNRADNLWQKVRDVQNTWQTKGPVTWPIHFTLTGALRVHVYEPQKARGRR